MKENSTSGQRIRRLRTNLSLKQEELAKIAGVSFQSVQNWEYDKSLPNKKRLKVVAEALKTTPTYILFGDEQTEIVDNKELKPRVLDSQEELSLKIGRAITDAPPELQEFVQTLLIRYETDETSASELLHALTTLVKGKG